jgi:putative inorganic carbon (hco3(-)) transporter
MSPHRLTYGAALAFPFSQVVAGVTLIGLVVTKDRRSFPVSPPIVVLILFILWMCLTAQFALHPDLIGEMFSKVLKIQLMLLVSLAVLNSRRHMELLLWVIVGSIGFYGVKGGIFTIATGGGSHVWGPPGTFIAGNNELAIAMVMIIPLAYYLYTMEPSPWRKRLLIGVALLTSVAVLGSQSRGGLLAIAAMSAVLWVRSSKKILMFSVLLALGIGLLAFMPESWHERMNTVKTYEQDGSAMGRLNAWTMAYNLAKDRWMGGSFEVAQPEDFLRYAPDPSKPLVAHSIYFQVLGEHGFLGLGIFLLLWFLTWRMAGRIRKEAGKYQEFEWMVGMMGMIQVSLAGYFVGGAFLSLAYFDMPYYLLGIVVLCNEKLKAHVRELSVQSAMAPGSGRILRNGRLEA